MVAQAGRSLSSSQFGLHNRILGQLEQHRETLSPNRTNKKFKAHLFLKVGFGW